MKRICSCELQDTEDWAPGDCREFSHSVPAYTGRRVGWIDRRKVVRKWAEAVSTMIGLKHTIRLRRRRDFLPSGFWQETYTNSRYDAQLVLKEDTYGWRACTNVGASALYLPEEAA